MAPQAGANGVLPVTVLHKNAPAPAPRGPKPPQQRLKLLVRRLPPGLTKTEFEEKLGDDWKLGGGRVDWFLYRKGKISKEHVSNSPQITPANTTTAPLSLRDRPGPTCMSRRRAIWSS
jgi:hypothetical protein